MFKTKEVLLIPAIFLFIFLINTSSVSADDCFCGPSRVLLGNYGLENQCRTDCSARNYTTYSYGTGASKSVRTPAPQSNPSNLGGGCYCDGTYIGNFGLENGCKTDCSNRRTQNYNYENTGNRPTGYTPPATPSPNTPGSTGSFQYKTMEGIPGVINHGQVYTFNQYVSAVYNFAIWAVGIAALLMLSIGGFMYLTSAGNNAAMSSAKGVIADAIIGLILALLSWLMLYIINPDLVSPSGITGGPETPVTPGPGPGPGPSPNPRTCSPGTGSCDQSNFSCFGNRARDASIICNAESSGRNAAAGDMCGNSPASIGLMQINLSANDIGGYNCTNAFTCRLGSSGCNRNTCQVRDTVTYNACRQAASNPTTNIQKGCELYRTQGFRPWTTARTCGIN